MLFSCYSLLNQYYKEVCENAYEKFKCLNNIVSFEKDIWDEDINQHTCCKKYVFIFVFVFKYSN